MILFVWFGWLKWFFFYAKAFWFHVLFFTNTWDCLLLLESCSENIYLYLYMEEFYCCLFFPHSVDNLSSMGSLLCPGNYMHESQGLARRCFFFFLYFFLFCLKWYTLFSNLSYHLLRQKFDLHFSKHYGWEDFKLVRSWTYLCDISIIQMLWI